MSSQYGQILGTSSSVAGDSNNMCDGKRAIGKTKNQDAVSIHQDMQSDVQEGSTTHEVHPTGSRRFPGRPDILWCLTLKEEGAPDRTFFKDEPWKGINSGLPGSDPDEDMESTAIMTYYVDAGVKNKTNKEPNTSKTWREQPVDFEFGRDATLLERHEPALHLYSKKVVNVIETIHDYYPYRGDANYFETDQDIFRAIMHCYAELKHYFVLYRQNLSNESPAHPKLDIGSCGDEKLHNTMKTLLNFGQFDVLSDPCDESTAYDLAVLLRLFGGMYRVKVVPTLTSVYLETKPTIGYDSMWILLRPGTFVYVKHSAIWELVEDLNEHSQQRRIKQMVSGAGQGGDEFTACVVAHSKYEKKDPHSPYLHQNQDHLEITLWSVYYNGTAFERVRHRVIIPKFDRTRPLRDLPIIPAHIHDSFDSYSLRDRLVQRGHKYVTIFKKSEAHRMYKHRYSAYDGDIIVDPAAYRQYVAADDAVIGSHASISPAPSPIIDGGGGKRFSGLVEINPTQAESSDRFKELCLLLPRQTEGFALRTKKWMVFEIEGISAGPPMASLNQLDTELVLVEEADRRSLRTVLPRGQRTTSSASDFVVGKGEGQIFLLYGPPGTGKTLTVECVANDTRRPLLRLTAQDVGLSNDVEANIRKWFTLAAKWEAILLIDEADLFLEQRAEGNLERNSLSTVFLRTMEYYNGVLFLTTNRPGHIDDSFISRITCPIAYPVLSPETKTKIVKKFVDRFQTSDNIIVEPSATRYLIQNCIDLNGRQLRNVLQNAVASAEVILRETTRSDANQDCGETEDVDMVTVKVGHVQAAVARQTEFQEYLKKLRGRDEETRARSKVDYLTVLPGSPGGTERSK